MRALRLGLVVAVALAGCGSSGEAPVAPNVARGSAFKGLVADAAVTVFALEPTGARGAVIGTGTTDASGDFDIGVGSYRGWAVVSVTGGSYEDEATGATLAIEAQYPLLGFANITTGATLQGNQRVAVNPVTTIAVLQHEELAKLPSARNAFEVLNSVPMVESYFGVRNIMTTTSLPDVTGSVTPGPDTDIALVIAAISEHANSLLWSAPRLTHTLARDLQDRRPDGLAFTVALGGLAPDAATNGLVSSLDDFLTVGRGAGSGLSLADTQIDEAILANAGQTLRGPLEIRSVRGSLGDVNNPSTLLLYLKPLLQPANPQVTIGTTQVTVTSNDVDEIAVQIPAGLLRGVHDLTLTDLDTGLVTFEPQLVKIGDRTAAPFVIDYHPKAGPLTGGSLIRFDGLDFNDQTAIEFDGIPGLNFGGDAGAWHFSAPRHAAGSVTITIRNGTSALTIPNGFTYLEKGVRSSGSEPDPTDALFLSFIKFFPDATDGTTFQTIHADVRWTDVDNGTFTLWEHSTSANDPTVRTGTRTGTAFQGVSPLGRRYLLFDSVNGLQDFASVSVNETTHDMFGGAGFGVAYAWPQPKTPVQVANLARRYWSVGLGYRPTDNLKLHYTGWLNFNDDGTGSANYRWQEQRLDGSGGDFGILTARIDWTLQANGEVDAQVQTDGPLPPNLHGYFSPMGSAAYLTGTGAAEVSGFVLTPVDEGLENGGYGGSWLGASVGGAFDPGDAEVKFDYHAIKVKLGLSANRHGLGFGFTQETEASASDPFGEFDETPDFAPIEVSPLGVVWTEGGTRIGFLNRTFGNLLNLGEAADFEGDTFAPDLDLAAGASVHRSARFSFQSLDGDYFYLGSKQQYFAQPPSESDPASLGWESAARIEKLDFDAATPGAWGGVSLNLSGTIPTWLATTAVGDSKIVRREADGSVTTTLGAPAPVAGEVLYTTLDDAFYVVGTRSVDPGGILATKVLPHAFFTLKLSNDGELMTGRDIASSDSTSTPIFIQAVPMAMLPVGAFRYMGLETRQDTGSTPTESHYVGNNGTYDFSGTTVTWTLTDRLWRPDGTSSSGSLSGTGTATQEPAGTVLVDLPTLGQLFKGATTPSGDVTAMLDVTPGLDRTGIVLAIKPRVIDDPLDSNWHYSGRQLEYGTDPGRSPQVERTTTHDFHFTPSLGTVNLNGEFLLRWNDRSEVQPGQHFRSTGPNTSTSEDARVPLLGDVPVLSFLFSQEGKSVGQTELVILVTPRIVVGMEE
ncbi:MAG: IPT/TIG domain-containing protein [Planctomycetota bacterium]|jgi:hypothetical protein